MESGGVRGAKGVLINITSSSQLGLHEVDEACSFIRAATENDDVQINFGIVLNESLEDEVRITVIATGFERESQAPPPPKPEWFEKTATPPPSLLPLRNRKRRLWQRQSSRSPRRFRPRSWMCPRSCAETGGRFSRLSKGGSRGDAAPTCFRRRSDRRSRTGTPRRPCLSRRTRSFG